MLRGRMRRRSTVYCSPAASRFCHGYWKNLAIALTNQFDRHVSPLWDHGHIKFWSKKTLSELLRETGFVNLSIHQVGRVPVLAKAMIVAARKK